MGGAAGRLGPCERRSPARALARGGGGAPASGLATARVYGTPVEDEPPARRGAVQAPSVRRARALREVRGGVRRRPSHGLVRFGTTASRRAQTTAVGRDARRREPRARVRSVAVRLMTRVPTSILAVAFLVFLVFVLIGDSARYYHSLATKCTCSQNLRTSRVGTRPPITQRSIRPTNRRCRSDSGTRTSGGGNRGDRTDPRATRSEPCSGPCRWTYIEGEEGTPPPVVARHAAAAKYAQIAVERRHIEAYCRVSLALRSLPLFSIMASSSSASVGSRANAVCCCGIRTGAYGA